MLVYKPGCVLFTACYRRVLWWAGCSCVYEHAWAGTLLSPFTVVPCLVVWTLVMAFCSAITCGSFLFGRSAACLWKPRFPARPPSSPSGSRTCHSAQRELTLGWGGGLSVEPGHFCLSAGKPEASVTFPAQLECPVENSSGQLTADSVPGPQGCSLCQPPVTSCAPGMLGFYYYREESNSPPVVSGGSLVLQRGLLPDGDTRYLSALPFQHPGLPLLWCGRTVGMPSVGMFRW